jgi:hypothetical protein
MATYVIELFGMSNEFADLRQVEVELEDEATLGQIVAALRMKAPALEGRIVRPGEDRLTNHYSFNVNGRFHIEEYDVKVHPGDHILLLTLALGG